MSKTRCVAEGAMARPVDASGDFVECVECESEVRWDMQDHPFWGFRSSCPKLRISVPPTPSGPPETD